jgi:hypothetical protein
LQQNPNDKPCGRISATTSIDISLRSSLDIEWIVLSIGMMGFLNKFMDAIGVELEAAAIEDVSTLLTPTGWKPGHQASTEVALPSRSTLPERDNLGTYFRVIQQLPSAIQIERGWTIDVPDRWPAAGDYLEKHTGYRFPLLGKLSQPRVVRALTTILRDNLDPAQTEIGLATKCLILSIQQLLHRVGCFFRSGDGVTNLS